MPFLDELKRRREAYAERRERILAELERVQQIVTGIDALIEDEGAGADTHGPASTDNDAGQGQDSPDDHREGGQPIGAVIDQALLEARGPLTFAEIKRHVETASPPVQVRNLDSSLSSALNYGVNAGKYRRVTRGVYTMSQPV